MRLEFKERKKGLLEKMFVYPSFSLRFWLYSSLLLLIAILILALAITKISSWPNRLSVCGLTLQGITLIFGIVATYFALKQLTESRFSKLEELGMVHLKNNRYFNAISTWKEALYIKSNSSIFFNLTEAYLIACRLEDFDEIVAYLEKKKSFQQKIIEEPRDYIIFCYLRTFRSLIVENMGVAKGYLDEMIDFVKKEDFRSGIGWNFDDIKKSSSYKKLLGDHKMVADNLMLYLERKLISEDKLKFDSKNYLFIAKPFIAPVQAKILTKLNS